MPARGKKSARGRNVIQTSQAIRSVIEQLETRRLLTVLVFSGGSGDDQIVVGTDPTDSTILDVTINGSKSSGPIAGVTQIDIDGGGGVDALTVQGTGASDIFTLTADTSAVTTNILPPVVYSNIDKLALDGDATANLSGASGPVTVFLGDSTSSANPNTVITGYGAPVTLTGVDIANLDAGGKTVTVTPTTQNDNTIYTPTGATSATFYDDIPSGTKLVPNTVFNVSNVAGNLEVFNDPGGSADQVTLRGTAARDLFQINQGSGVAQVLANNVTPLLPVELGISAEILNVQGIGGQDTFQVIPAPGIAGQAQDNMLINLDGGASGASDALVIGSSFGNTPANLSANQFAVVDRSQTPDSGFVRVFTSGVANPDINYTNISTVAPLVASPANLLALGPDTYEPNNSQGAAAFLGAGAAVQIQNGVIFPTGNPGVPADQDFYQLVAQSTGTLDFQVAFRDFNPALLPGGGQLDLQVFDAAGDVIGSATGTTVGTNFGAVGATANARVRIPAVAGQSYFLRVFGATSNVINGYNATIVNTPAPVPATLGLANFAKQTYTSTPTIYLHLDDGSLLNDLPGNQTSGSALGVGPIAIPFNADTSITPTTAGYRVAVYDEGSGTPVTGADHTLDPNDPTFIGFAQPVASVPHEYALTVGSQGTDSLDFGVHALVARVQIADPATPLASGFGELSTATKITVINDALIGATGKTISGKESRTVSATVATFSDVNVNAPTSNFSASINWGDGHTTTGTIVSDGGGNFHVTGSHAYVEQGNYALKVTINEIGGTSAIASGTAKIADAPLDSAAGQTHTASKNVAFTNLTLGTFRDQDFLNKFAGDYTGTIDWGDGSAKTSAKFVFNGATTNVGSFWKVQGSHKYTKTGTFTVKITVKDAGAPLLITAVIKVK